jgi:TDG/mug DNA glycosylase family protein
LFGEAPASTYSDRLAFVAAHRIALWDVCETGEREASADSTIRKEQPNAIDRLLDQHPLIHAVAFNGAGARRLYDRHFPRYPRLGYLALPSTSPAHARIDFAGKLARWLALREVLEDWQPL